MIFIKVDNVWDELTGFYDYRGLDLSLIVAGTQLYPDHENAAYFAYAGEAVSHEDVSVITEADYVAAREEIELYRPKSPFEQLQEQVDAMTVMVGDLLLGGE